MNATKTARKISTKTAGAGASAKHASTGAKRAAAPTAAPQSASPAKVTKHKLVRDSFTIPKSEYAVLEGLKSRATNLKRPVKKSELLRAGIASLHAMSDKAFLAVLGSIPSLKTGRPKGERASDK